MRRLRAGRGWRWLTNKVVAIVIAPIAVVIVIRCKALPANACGRNVAVCLSLGAKPWACYDMRATDTYVLSYMCTQRQVRAGGASKAYDMYTLPDYTRLAAYVHAQGMCCNVVTVQSVAPPARSAA